jgi:DNA-binding transcriptional regulator YiaG
MNQITDLRARLGLSVPQLAYYLGVSALAIIKYENGTRQPGGALLRLIEVMQTLEVMAPAIHAHMMPSVAPTNPVEEGLPID